jgi:hypothetical protein
MWLTIKHAIIIVAAFALLLLVFRLGIYVRRIAESTSHVPTEDHSSPQASPEIGSSPIALSRPAPPVGQETPEDRDVARPAETPLMIKAFSS